MSVIPNMQILLHSSGMLNYVQNVVVVFTTSLSSTQEL